MVSNAQTIPKLLRNLRDNGKVLLQCGALTYIRSNAEKLEMSSTLTEEEYMEICRLVIDMVASTDQNVRTEATKALQVILKCFKSHNIKFFESALQISRDKRLKIFQFLQAAEDGSVATAALDPSVTNFMQDCMQSIDPNTMGWLSPTACTDNLENLTQAENKSLTNDQELEELIVNNAMILLQRLYKIALTSTNVQSVEKFNTLLMDKIMTLIYMGHRRQRGPAIRLLIQAIEANLGMHIKTTYSEIWTKYKTDLQGPYSVRMSLLVKACEPDWSNQWSISIQLLGTDLHRGAALINNLLSVEERAFKSTDTLVRRQAFVSWKLLIDNFALDMKELATARRIKLLCVPLTAKNSKSELIALTKLEVWWYLIAKLYQNVAKFADPVITQFLNFCFGPLGDTPLLSTKFDVIASPVKRFHKTKIIAIDALLQLLVVRQKDRIAFVPILEDRLPKSITEGLFNECYKAFLHSVGEAVVMMGQLNDNEMRNREEICKVLWTNLMHYVRTTSDELKNNVNTEFLRVIIELENRALDVTFVNSFLRDVILPELTTMARDLIYYDKTLVDLMMKIMVPSFLKNLQAKHCDSIKCLIWQTVRPKVENNCPTYHTETLAFLETTLQQLRSVPIEADSLTGCFELWFVYAEIACKFMKSLHDVNEGSSVEPNFKTIEAIVSFPFSHMYWANSIQAQRIAVHWKDVYKKFECQADVILSPQKPNETFDNTSRMIEQCLVKNEKCYRIAVYCLDALLSTINYKFLLAQNKIPPIVRLVGDLTTISLHEGQPAEAECALKALSSLLITVYGHSPEKALAYLKVTSQTVELMLKIEAEDSLVKEITSTWETIVSILRGLNNLLDHNFLMSYKHVILLAVKHANDEISSQTLSLLEIKDNLRENAAAVLMELAQESKKSTTKKDTGKKVTDRTAKQTRIAGSFLNRRIPSPRPGKTREKEEKKFAPLPPEPDSQDYVVIKSEVKLDVNRLTEHQKESFKRRRDDIPAMYNDLSQSSSQDTQDIQQWFDGKKKRNEATKVLLENEKLLNVDEDPNKENKIDKIIGTCEEKIIEEPTVEINSEARKEAVGKCPTEISTPEVVACSGQDPNSDLGTVEISSKSDNLQKSSEKHVQKSSGKDWQKFSEKNNKEQNDKIISSSISDHSYVGEAKSPEVDPPINDKSAEMIVKKLNFESREEYPDEKRKKGEENLSNEMDLSNKSQRPSRRAKTQPDSNFPRKRGKSGVFDKETKNPESAEISTAQKSKGTGKTKGNSTRRPQSSGGSTERGTKRKAASDSETDETEREKRRKKSPVSSGDADSNVQSIIDKRRESEMTRLRIDMVFDGPAPTRRRSKYNDDFVSSDTISKRQSSPDGRSTRGKTGDQRNSGNVRKSSRSTEKEDAGNSDATKKRRRRTTRTDAESKDEEGTQIILTKSSTKSVGRTKKSLQDSGAASESQTIDDEAPEGATSAENRKLAEEKNEEAKNTPTEETTPSQVAENSGVEMAETPMENDDEVIESSQDYTVLSSSHRRSFTKIIMPKISNDSESAMEAAELPVEKKHLPSSSPINPLVESVAVTKNPLEEEKIDDADETFLDISAIRPQLADDVPSDDAEKKAPEASKTSASPASTKTGEGFNFSSPKAHLKRLTKPKGFPSQGRAAHMIGLVTKLAALEKNIHVDKIEDTAIMKKLETQKMRWKEIETSLTKGDRQTIAKEPEKMGSPGGSRQEKIFNNMKSVDYASSPPSKLFCNLRNGGEKISPKMEKTLMTNDHDGEATRIGDEDGNVSPANEKDELQILEWSSANPPSLTASPSSSILKRHRVLLVDLESDSMTPNKMTRKRVSFADPPVSKQMGYEIETLGSPHKISKFGTSRTLLGRRDSPMRLKQTRFRMIQIDPEKNEREEEPRILSSSDVDLECERDNALLLKIAEDLEETPDMHTPENIDSEDVSVSEKNEMKRPEIDVCQVEEAKKLSENFEGIEKPIVAAKKIEEAQTQDDLFNSSDEKPESPKKLAECTIEIANSEFNISGQNSTMESFKLNVTDDSIIGHLTDPPTEEETNKCDSLEDTVDARNITGLNSTANSDEIFAAMPVKTSTQAPDPISEMDTLPVTDSIFASLPITQDSQGSTQANVELARPELLNSTEAIYPALIDCREPIDSVIDSLTNPLWRKNLAKNLETRGIRTIGDMAKLSEREVVRIPVKGSSKIDFVRKILGKLEQRLRDSGPKETNVSGSERLIGNEEREKSSKISDDIEVDELLRTIGKSLGDISALGDTSKVPGNPTTLDVSVLGSGIERNDTLSIENLEIRHTLGRTSTINSTSTIMIDPSICAVLDDTSHVSHMSTINLSSDTLPVTRKSVEIRSVEKSTQSTQTTLDELDANIVLQSVVKRIDAEKLFAEYRRKMIHMTDFELNKEIMRILGIKRETILEAVSLEYGLEKVVEELFNIFGSEFNVKIFNAVRDRISVTECLDLLDRQELKNVICKKISSHELLEMLLGTLKEDERQNVKTPITEVTSLKALLKRIPMDLIIDNALANESVIPSSVMLDVALKSNKTEIVGKTIDAEYPEIVKNIIERRINHEAVVEHIEVNSMSREQLLSIHKAACAKLSPRDLLNGFCEAMNGKLNQFNN